MGTHVRGPLLEYQEADDLLRDGEDHPENMEAQTSEVLSEEPVAKSQGNNAEAAKMQNSLKARKRTKTGCLTCRKRRIKCGEERPTCANCIKSKRGCEGYAPRLTFKDPLGFRPGWAMKGNGAHFQSISTQGGAIGQYNRSQLGTGAQNQLPAIAPRPSLLGHFEGEPSGSIQEPHNDFYSSSLTTIPNAPKDPYISYANNVGAPVTAPIDLPPQMPQMYQRQGSLSGGREDASHPRHPEATLAGSTALAMQNSHYVGGISSSDNVGRPSPNAQWSHNLIPATNMNEYAVPSQHHPSLLNNQIPTNNKPYQRPQLNSQDYAPECNTSHYLSPVYDASNAGKQPPMSIPNTLYHSAGGDYTAFDTRAWEIGQNQDLGAHAYPKALPAYHILNSQDALRPNRTIEKSQHHFQPEPAISIDEADDEYYDVVSDEEETNNENRIANTPQNDVGLMLALSASRDDRAPRSYTTFLNEPNVLLSYRPKFTASPLMDSKTARIFCHFITATGPSLSIYERHPTNTSLMFTGAPVPSSQQALWTYTLPMMAISDQALLHAMLALASLHIAKLQNTSITSSLSHYQFAIKRIAKAVATPSKRTKIATIAATLILSFYEASTAEHSKWNSHLTGARQLLMEVDFRGMTKRIKENKAQTAANSLYANWQNSYNGFKNYPSYSNNMLPNSDNRINERLVSQIMGWKIRFDEYGLVVDENVPLEPPKIKITPKDIETYQTYGDLFWWYCKQDVYQSIISGNRLLLPYHRWAYYPPRAPIGRLDAVYGTMDHLILLMGRIADFSSEDQLRKRKVMEANGGQWRPPPGMFPSPPSGHSGPPPRFQGPPPGYTGPPTGSLPMGMPQHGQTQPTMPVPPMYGMIPNAGPAPMPSAFTQAPRDKLYFGPTINENIELDNALREAEAEWQEIQNALELFEDSLDHNFQPLTADVTPPIMTPFGDALEYRTYSISCIWVMYYTGRIIAARMHPSMPPAAMMAAGVAASKTSHWAQIIGRICAGLQPAPSNQPLNPSLGAALMESTLGLFFAGVQYRDADQRRYIITALRNIADLTGWQSSALIAAGCEVSWVKMAEAGRGPPYQKTMELTAKDDRVAGRTSYNGDDITDKRYVGINPGTRVHFAMGIMSMEEDFQNLSVGQ